jgi:hypothetical protein
LKTNVIVAEISETILFYKMAASAAILDLFSVDYLTNAWVDWSDFFVAYWGRLEEGSSRRPAPPLIQLD